MFIGVLVQQQPSFHPNQGRRPEPKGAYMPLGLSPVSLHTALHHLSALHAGETFVEQKENRS
jgi:hypothetical protein